MPGKDRFKNSLDAEKVLLEDARNLMVVSPEKKKLVAISGLENFIVVDTDDVLLICPKDDKRFKDFISGIAMPEYEKYR
jgi:mannose-1-phosphate guanylyltransferase